MALIMRVVKPETMSMEDLEKLHKSFGNAFQGSPAYIGVEICLSNIDTLENTRETYFPVIIGNGNNNDITITVNAEEIFKSMHKYVPADLSHRLAIDK